MSWPKVRLGDVGTLIRGKGIKRSETCATGKPCIRYGEIYTSFNVLLDKPRSFVDDALFDDCPHIKKGDLVLTLTGENKEEIAKTLCYLGDEEIAAGGDLAIWSGHGCDPKFLAYLMYSPAMIKAKADASNGHIVVHASVKKLQDIEIPLPSLAEQKKIVEKVEKALKRVDALKAQFERLEKSAADYFKAALAETFAAVKGEKVKLGDVCETISVGIVIRPTRYYTAKGIKAFRNTNIRACEIRDDDWVQVTDAAINENPRCEVKMGDVVIARSGLPGTAAAVTSAYDGFAAVDILIAKPIAARADYHYLAYAINTSEAQRQIKKMNNGVAQAHIGVNSVSSLLLTLPAKESQKAVVDALDAAKSKSERMVTAARRGIAICGKMRKAILAEAFQ